MVDSGYYGLRFEKILSIFCCKFLGFVQNESPRITMADCGYYGICSLTRKSKFMIKKIMLILVVNFAGLYKMSLNYHYKLIGLVVGTKTVRF